MKQQPDRGKSPDRSRPAPRRKALVNSNMSFAVRSSICRSLKRETAHAPDWFTFVFLIQAAIKGYAPPTPCRRRKTVGLGVNVKKRLSMKRNSLLIAGRP